MGCGCLSAVSFPSTGPLWRLDEQCFIQRPTVVSHLADYARVPDRPKLRGIVAHEEDHDYARIIIIRKDVETRNAEVEVRRLVLVEHASPLRVAADTIAANNVYHGSLLSCAVSGSLPPRIACY